MSAYDFVVGRIGEERANALAVGVGVDREDRAYWEAVAAATAPVELIGDLPLRAGEEAGRALSAMVPSIAATLVGVIEDGVIAATSDRLGDIVSEELAPVVAEMRSIAHACEEIRDDMRAEAELRKQQSLSLHGMLLVVSTGAVVGALIVGVPLALLIGHLFGWMH